MTNYTLVDGLNLYPTPGGAYYAVSSKRRDKARSFLQSVFNNEQTPILDIRNLNQLTGIDNEEKSLELLHHCQKLGWIQGLKSVKKSPEGPLEELLPGLLSNLSEGGKVLLADSEGFYLSSSGFPHEVAEELAALSAEIATVHDNRSGLLMNNLGLASNSWAFVDTAGNSKIGFWPIFIGNTRFVLIISGSPRLNQPEIVSLIWALSIRYANN